MAEFGAHFAAAHHDGERPSFLGATGPKIVYPEDTPETRIFDSEA